MKTAQHFMSKMRERKGAVAVIVAIVLAMLIGFVALAVDVGYVMVTRNELQNVADASALAGARQLGANYEPLTYEEQQSYNCNPATIIAAAKDVALKNTAAGQNIVVRDEDVIIGDWNTDTKTLTVTLSRPDAVRVTARRDGSANNPITTFFARIFGVDDVSVTATATAALTSISKVGPGGLPIPVGISKKWFEAPIPSFCNQPIKMYPTGTLEGCAGWHTYEDDPSNASKLRKILEGLENNSYTSPETIAGESVFEFTGGTVASVFDEMKALFDANKSDEDGDGDLEWTTTVVVYDYDDCSNPHGPIKIVGFATAVIDEVLEPPDKIINAHVICENIEFGRGSGGEYGTMGSIPNLVQ